MKPQRKPTRNRPNADGAEAASMELFSNIESPANVTAPFDTAALDGARFRRVVLLTNGRFAAEFLPHDLGLPRLLLDEPELYAAVIFAPALNEELTTALEAIERMRRRMAR